MILLLFACAYDPDEFAPAFARVACDRYDDCGDPPYGDEDTCRDRTERDVRETTACIEDHCRWEPDAAAECLSAVREAECAEFNDGTAFLACADLWAQCDDVGAACQLP